MSVLHITAGSLKGRRVRVPPHDLRPTSTRARQAFFNIVAGRVEGSRFLDLFSGSGIFSFEALSRGAASAVAVDYSPKAIRTIAQTAEEIGAPLQTLQSDALAAVRRLAGGEPFSLVYADPPYDYAHYGELLEAIDASLPLAEGAVVGVEHREKSSPAEGRTLNRLNFRKKVSYGSVAISLFDGGA